VRNGVVILSGKKGLERNRVTNFLRNRGVIIWVKIVLQRLDGCNTIAPVLPFYMKKHNTIAPS
jgi:predicted permease